MIHYHGTPISGTARDSVRFLAGRHALVSYAYPSPVHVVAEQCQSFVLDNGAFTVWKKGGELDIEGYKEWASKWMWHPGFDWALIPDRIEGNEADNDGLIADWEKSGFADIGVPVWHFHESLGRLQSLALQWRTVALGSSGEWPHPGAKKWWARMRQAMNAVCDNKGRPICRLHGLRMMDPRIFTKCPFSSADSTNAGVNAGAKDRFGMYIPPSAGQRVEVIASRIEANNSASRWVSE